MENQEENWKDVPNYIGAYQVSNLGRIKSLSRSRVTNGKSFKTVEKILSPRKNQGGYYNIKFCKDGKIKTYGIHKVVAMAFMDHIPCGHLLIINHINHIRTDNRLLNLEVVTQRENSTTKKGVKHSSIYPGVSWYKKDCKWRARIYMNKKSNHLGYFDNEADAYAEYLKALNGNNI